MNTINIERKFKFERAPNDFYKTQKVTEKQLWLFSIAKRCQINISCILDGDLSQDLFHSDFDQKLKIEQNQKFVLQKSLGLPCILQKQIKSHFQGVMRLSQKKLQKNKKRRLPTIQAAQYQIQSQQQDIQIKMEQWLVVYNKQKTSLDQIATLSLLSTKSELVQPTELNIKTTDMDLNKAKQAKSLANYISTTFNNHIPQTLNLMMHTFGIIENKVAEKIQVLSQKMNCNLETCKQQLKTTKTKMVLCFSSKWRQSQITLYLLVRPFNSNSKQSNRVRIHILNHRGLILQTVSNLDQQKYLEQISAVIMKHYKRLYNIIVIPPSSNSCDIDQFILFINSINKNSTNKNHFPKPLGLALFNYQRKQTLSQSYLLPKQYFQHLTTQIEGQISLWKDNKNQFLIWHNQNIQLNSLPPIISKISEIINRQERLAQYFDKYDYYSGHFNQKQILLRFFAFYFNFITIESMIPENKESLLYQVADSEENNFQSMQKELQSINFQSKTHTFIVHSAPLPCSVCKKRTKSRCEKCSLDFNKLFGLCQKQCFQRFHSNIIKYSDEIEKSKRVYSKLQQDKNSQFEDQIDLSASNGRKRVKLEEEPQKIEEQPKKKNSLQSLKDKWRSHPQLEMKQFQQFYEYASVGLISQNIMKKVEFIRSQLSQTKIQNINEPLIKLE